VTGSAPRPPDAVGTTVAGRAAVAAVTAVTGATVLAASTHPFSSWQDMRLVPSPRHLHLLGRWGLLALQQDNCSTSPRAHSSPHQR